MKKRIFGMLLVVTLLLSGLQANAKGIRVEEVAVINNLETESIWEERAYLDEFNMPTDEYYISNSSAIIGTFSNSATTDSLLEVYFFIIDGDTVVIRLIEYGSSVVKNSYSSDKTYSVVMMDTYGERHSLIGTLSSGADVLCFDRKDSRAIVRALRDEGTVRFAITEDERPTTKYVFSIEDACGFEIDAPINSIGYLDGGLIEIRRGELYGLMDTEGNIVARCVYYFMLANKESELICVATGSTVNGFHYDYGFINKSGEVIVPCEYDSVSYSFYEGLAKVEKDGKYGYIDTTGKLVVPCEYDDLDFFYEGLARVEKDGKWGYVDTTGTLVIPCEYDYVWSFGEGLAYMEKDDKCGYIDTTGTLVIPCEYDYAWPFREGLAYVKKDDKCGFIDTTGTPVIPCEYDDVSRGGDVIITLDDEKITVYSIVEN